MLPVKTQLIHDTLTRIIEPKNKQTRMSGRMDWANIPWFWALVGQAQVPLFLLHAHLVDRIALLLSSCTIVRARIKLLWGSMHQNVGKLKPDWFWRWCCRFLYTQNAGQWVVSGWAPEDACRSKEQKSCSLTTSMNQWVLGWFVQARNK